MIYHPNGQPYKDHLEACTLTNMQVNLLAGKLRSVCGKKCATVR